MDDGSSFLTSDTPSASRVPPAVIPSSNEYWAKAARGRLAHFNARGPGASVIAGTVYSGSDVSLIESAILRELDDIETVATLLRARLSEPSSLMSHMVPGNTNDKQSSALYWMETLKEHLSLSKDSELLIEELLAIDEAATLRELNGIGHASSLVKETRNTLCSPIFALPDETLIDIFKYCTSQADPRSGQYTLERMRITFVCRRWRSTCIETPLFWTDIRFILRRCVDIFLDRSKAAPLSVMSSGQQGDNVLNFHLWHIECLELIHVSFRSDHHLNAFVGLIGKQAPMLRSLSATNGRGRNFPQGFLLSAPLLRELKTSGFVLDWSSFHWENLITLDMDRRSAQLRSPLGTFESLITNMAKAKHLQTLVLRDYVPSPNLQTIVHLLPIHLNHLQELKLSGRTSACVPLLCLLRIPPSATLTLTLHGGDQDFMPSFLTSLHEIIQKRRSGTQPFTSIQFDGGGWHSRYLSVSLECCRGPSPFRVRHLLVDGIKTEGGSPAMSIGLSDTSLGPEYKLSLLSTFPFDHLVSAAIGIELHNHVTEYEDHPVWADFVASATRLTHLHLMGSPVHGFTRALHAHSLRASISEADVQSANDITPLAALRELLLGRFDIHSTSLNMPLHDALPDCIALVGRGKLGSLWIYDAGYKLEWINRLRPLAEEVLIPLCRRVV
ncbi:hypothetical protein PENSPDRAFT_751202 [Peniophora sp. CONT]|nr:hypothetical protein PENSPDRAFT_751202 [Peniophora sp. CONT]